MGLGGSASLNGDAAAGYWVPPEDGQYEDYAPFAPPDNDVPFCLASEPDIIASTTSAVELDGDGDDIVEAGETIQLDVELRNWCLVSTDANLSASIEISEQSAVSGSIAVEDSIVNDGVALGPGDTALAVFTIELGASDVSGELLLELTPVDDSRTYPVLPLTVSVEGQIGAGASE